MKRKILIIFVVALMFITACKGKNDDSINIPEQMAEPVEETHLSTEKITAEETTEQAYQPATREYFENVDKAYTLDDIKNEIGKNDGLFTSTDNKICTIYFRQSDKFELYYYRYTEDGKDKLEYS